MTKELLSIPPEILEKVQAATGQQAPNVNSKDFNVWLDTLIASHPLLAQDVADSIEMSVETPIEAATKKANSQKPFYQLVHRLFYKDDWGKSKLNRQAILAFAFLVTSVVIASGYLVSNQSYAKQKRERNEARIAAQTTNTPTEVPVIAIDADRVEDIKQVDAVITEEQTPIIQVPEEIVKTQTEQNTEPETEAVSVPNKLIYERESNPDESMLIVNQDIPPPSLKKQTALVTQPPTTLNTPLPPSAPNSNYQVLNERPEDVVLEHQRGISTFQRDSGNDYATFGDGSGLSPFKRPISATSPQSALVVNSQMRELAPMAAYINDSPSETAALTAYTNPDTEQAALTAYTNSDTGQAALTTYTNPNNSQAALTAYSNPNRSDSLATLTAYKNNSDTGQAALTTYTNPDSNNRLATLTAYKNNRNNEQAALTAYVNPNAGTGQAALTTYNTSNSSLQPLTAYQNNSHDEQAALTAYNADRSNQTASLTAYNNSNNNNELATLTAYKNNSHDEQAALTSYNEDSNNSSLRKSANLFKRTTEQSSISTYANSNSSNSSSTVMFNRTTDHSGMTVMNTGNENDSNSSGTSEILFRRSGSNTPIIETVDTPKTAGGRDILFSRSAPNKASEDTVEITKLNGSIDDAAERLLIPTLKTGQIYLATLVTNAVAIQGANSNRSLVVAESKEWCEDSSKACPVVRWIGESQYNNGRINIEFTSIMVGTKTVGGMGIAFANDNSQGLSATVSDTSPTLASDLIRSAASGVSDYANALATASKVTTNGQFLVEETAAPDLWSFLMGSAASTLSIPNNTTSLVRSAHTASGETFQILYQDTGNGYNNAAFR